MVDLHHRFLVFNTLIDGRTVQSVEESTDRRLVRSSCPTVISSGLFGSFPTLLTPRLRCFGLSLKTLRGF